MDFSGMPFSSGHEEPSSNELIASVNKMRRAVQSGAMEKRAKLVNGLSQLSAAYAQEGQYKKSLEALDEAIELGDVLAEEGQIDPREELALDVFPLMVALRSSEEEAGKSFDRHAFYSRFNQCVNKAVKKRPDDVQLFWIKETYEQAQDLYKQDHARNPIISMLDTLLKEVEPKFNRRSQRFVEWDGLMNPYLLRGLCKYDLGDRNSAIEDLKRYEELSDIAVDLLNQRKMKSKSDPIKDGKIVIRVNMDDFVDLMGSVSFRNKRFDCLNHLAHMYAEKAEKNKALEYYDKALHAATQKLSSPFPMTEGFNIYSAKAEMPFRKGHIYFLFHEYEKALELFDEAIHATESLLETDNKNYLEGMEAQFSHYCRERSDVLKALKRFDEAAEAIDRASDYFSRIQKAAAERFRAFTLENENKAEQEDNDDPMGSLQLSNMFGQQSSPPKKDSHRRVPDGPKKDIKDMSERDLLILLGTKHNEAMMDFQRGRLDYERQRYRSAMAKFLKTRIVLDFFMLQQIHGTRQNKILVYFQIASTYGRFRQFDKAELWLDRTAEIARQLIDEGMLEMRPEYCRILAARGQIFALQDKWDKATQSFEQSIESGKALVDEALENIEGQDLEKLLEEDNQQIMKVIELLCMQTTAYKEFIATLLHRGRLEEAVTRSHEYVQCTEEMMRLVPDHGMPLSQYGHALRWVVPILRLARQDEQADLTEERAIAFYRKREVYLGLEEAKNIFSKVVETQLFAIFFSVTSLRIQQDNYCKALNLAKAGKTDEALEAIAKIRETVILRVRFGEEDPPVVVQLREHLLAMLDRTAGYIRDNKLDKIQGISQSEEPDVDATNDIIDILDARLAYALLPDETDTEDYTIYERELPGHDTTYELMLHLSDELGGTKSYEHYTENVQAGRVSPEMKLLEGFARIGATIRNKEDRIGRNDPCPCGSGKKYKKCCGM